MNKKRREKKMFSKISPENIPFPENSNKGKTRKST